MSIKLMAAIKDEGPFLMEWIAHHRVVGFDDIMIAYNDCTDGSAELLERLAEHGVIKTLHNEVLKGKGPQKAAYAKMRKSGFLDDTEWVCILDADEFLNIHIGDHTVQSLLSHFQDADIALAHWYQFGDAGLASWSDENVTTRFTIAAPVGSVLHGGRKSFTHFPQNFANLEAHMPNGFKLDRKVRIQNMANQLFELGLDREIPTRKQLAAIKNDMVAHELAQINHYPIKTFDSFVLRAVRGRGVRKRSAENLRHTVPYFMNFQEICTETETSILRYKEKVDAELRWMRTLKSISDLESYILKTYRARLRTVEKLVDDDKIDLRNLAVTPIVDPSVA